MSNTFLWLVRDGDDLVNWCRCRRESARAMGGLVGRLAQAACPWCGCGWLFSCVTCGKSFAFARVGRVYGRIEDVAIADFERFFKRPPEAAELIEAVDVLKWMMDGLREGQRVVVLDGTIIDADHEGPLEFEGWHARHSLPWVPHTRALTHPEVETDILTSVDYWEERRITDPWE